ncbi:hypothetical protein MLD52_14345 [Puniceicoccaceae bacterium K14]|nr:hypothetical protein [Puniceicoccaceae bacterium K14]
MKIKISSCLLILVAVTPLAQTLSAEGLLGKKYFEIVYKTGNLTNSFSDGDIDVWGVNTRLNIPLANEDETVSYDAFISLSHAEIDDSTIDGDGQEIDLGIVFYNSNSKFQDIEFKPFLALSGGYADGTIFEYSDKSFIYTATAGIEFPIDNFITITPYFRYVNIVELEDGDDTIAGIDFNFWITKRSNIGINWEQVSNSGSTLDVYGFAFRIGF